MCQVNIDLTYQVPLKERQMSYMKASINLESQRKAQFCAEEKKKMNKQQFTWPTPQDTPQAMIDKLNTAEVLVRDVKNQVMIKQKVNNQ